MLSTPTFSILIATTTDRREMFLKLWDEFESQIGDLPVELLYEEDNKEMSIGKKRQKLLNRATGQYIVFFDSDDFPSSHYVRDILEALEEGPDCVGFLIHFTTNGINPKLCCHSLRYKEWKGDGKIKIDGYDYVRSVSHFNPVKRELALKAGFKDMRFAEDIDYSKRLTPLCKTEVFINKRMFHYRYTNTMSHKKKYGFIK